MKKKSLGDKSHQEERTMEDKTRLHYLEQHFKAMKAKEVLHQRLRIHAQHIRAKVRAIEKYQEDLSARFVDGQVELAGMESINPTPEIAALLNDPSGVL
jgi:hypothetical protein